MKVLLFLALILSICSVGFAAESVGFYRNPAHPGKCVIGDLILSAGEEAKLPKTCGRISCGGDSFVTIQTCGVRIPPPGCNYTDYVNIDAPYSECCERKLVC